MLSRGHLGHFTPCPPQCGNNVRAYSPLLRQHRLDKCFKHHIKFQVRTSPFSGICTKSHHIALEGYHLGTVAPQAALRTAGTQEGRS